jgi:hypothetical protein
MVLIKCRRTDVARLTPLGATLLVDVRAFQALETDECYVYAALASARAGAELSPLARDVADCAPGAGVSLRSIVASRARRRRPKPRSLRRRDRRASRNESDFNRWYDVEHLPGWPRHGNRPGELPESAPESPVSRSL